MDEGAAGIGLLVRSRLAGDAREQGLEPLRHLLAKLEDVIRSTPGEQPTSFTPNWDEARGVAIQGDGKIVAAGGSGEFGPHPKFALARYLSA